MSMLACFYAFMLVLASLVLGFAMLNALSGYVVVWLRGCVVTSDAHKAFFGRNHLGCISMMPVALCIPLTFRSVR